MSSDSSFQENMQDPNNTQGAVPSKPEPGNDDSQPNPDDPGKYDPLSQPDKEEDARPEDWNEPPRDVPEADEQTPLSDDRR
jgi:hypothetical protein